MNRLVSLALAAMSAGMMANGPATAARAPADTTAAPRAGHGAHEPMMPGMPGMTMEGATGPSSPHAMHMSMTGMYGPYSATREASGTSWQPDAALHRGLHAMVGDWMLMLHGVADLVWDDQGGERGGEKLFSSNMLMGMAQRPGGPGTLGLQAMASVEPATIGKDGYPLLLQTGETADGVTPLVDRQHPHDLFMELAGSYSVSSGGRSLFVYGGLPGEPALGPPAFMHRFSGMALPEAPLTHHWLDSTHISYGVVTVGAVADRLKLEASAFRGREPDENRWNIESPRLDSYSFRLSFNPTPAWALQASAGHLESPEQLDPGVDTDRTTASAIYASSWDGGHFEATLAWGRNRNRPGHTLDALAAEGAATVRERHTVFSRLEWVEKDELFPAGDPLHDAVFDVGKLSAGYRLDVMRREHLTAGIGALGSVFAMPEAARAAYGDHPLAAMLFVHVALR
ncbi:MAG TPA: hypothetical protein VI792_08370 [Candidatus Eisenbacteria bacterium]